MSFMYNPYPYDDPAAVNHVNLPTSLTDTFVYGNKEVSETIKKACKEFVKEHKRCVVAVDAYPGADFEKFSALFPKFKKINIRDIYKPQEEVRKILKDYLYEDPKMDPVYLYGKLWKKGWTGLFDSKKQEEIVNEIKEFKQNGKGVLLVYGLGSLETGLRELMDLKIWVDVIPLYSVLNAKRGNYINVGDKEPLPYKLMMRRSYYVDYENSIHVRREVLGKSIADFWINGNHPDNLMLCPMKTLDKVFDTMVKTPYRCKPVYCEGVWGGSFVKRIRHLPEEMVNCAWVFDLIPSEVSMVVEANGKKIEFPYYSFVHSRGLQVMGEKANEQWKGYFPIRYNYDDTWHSSGNMSIQCHPDEDYVKKENDEWGRQDEAYYVVEAAEGARTYLGFKNENSGDEFMKEVYRMEKDHQPIDYLKYVAYIESKPGTQILLPAGTIHSSGRNQLILEGGTLTIGSYTYKLYDYMRKDLDGQPRPIFSIHGDRVLQKKRTLEWCKKHIVGYARPKEDNEDVLTQRVGHDDLCYYDMYTTQFEKTYEDDVKDKFHVLALTNGDKVRVYSKKNKEFCYEMNYLDIIVVPNCVSEYVVENIGNRPATIHKTQLKEDFEHQLDTYYKARKEFDK